MIAESSSFEYMAQLAIAKEEAGEIKIAVFLSNVNHIEAQRRWFKNIQHKEGILKGNSTSKAMVREENGETKEYTDKISIETLIAAEN